MKNKIFLLIGLLLNMPLHMFAQDQLQILINKGIENNALIKSKGLDQTAAQQWVETYKQFPKTNFNFIFGRNEGFEFNDAISVSQSLPLPSTFKAKKNHLEAQVLSKDYLKQISINDLKAEIRSKYYELGYLNQNAKVLKNLDSLYNNFIQIAKLRFSTGEAKEVDIFAAENQKGEIEQLLKENGNSREALIKILNFLVGEEITTNFNDLSELSTTDLNTSFEHPLSKYLYQEAKVLEAQKEIERTQALPEFTLSYTNASLIGPHAKNGIEKWYGRGQRFGYVDLGVSVPLSNKSTKAKINALETQKMALNLQADYQQEQLVLELQNAYKNFFLFKDRYQYYVEKGLPNTNRILNGSQLGYTTGETSYLEYLLALKTTTEVRLKHLETLKNLNQSVINIWHLLNI